MSTIIIKNIWLEDVFFWFVNHVLDKGGDGSAAMVCKNYIEVADYFRQTYRVLLNPFITRIDPALICFHDNNENFIFTNDYNIQLRDKDYIFIIEEDCKAAKTDFILKGINNESNAM
jgi:hypothetical protein